LAGRSKDKLPQEYLGKFQMRCEVRRKHVMATSAMIKHWIMLVGAGVLLFNVINGVATGSATLFYGQVKKSQDPLLFWISIVLSAVLGAAVLYFFIFDRK
jgi:hypothetical protein